MQTCGTENIAIYFTRMCVFNLSPSHFPSHLVIQGILLVSLVSMCPGDTGEDDLVNDKITEFIV